MSELVCEHTVSQGHQQAPQCTPHHVRSLRDFDPWPTDQHLHRPLYLELQLLHILRVGEDVRESSSVTSEAYHSTKRDEEMRCIKLHYIA